MRTVATAVHVDTIRRLPYLRLRCADPAQAVARFGGFGRVGMMIREVPVELNSEIELALGLGTPPRIQQLGRRELRRRVYHRSFKPRGRRTPSRNRTS